MCPGFAPSLKLQCPPCFSRQLSCSLGMLPGRRMFGAAAGAGMATELCVLPAHSPIPVCLSPLKGRPQGLARADTGAVRSPSLPLGMFTWLNLTPQPASSLPAEPTCSPVAGLRLLLLFLPAPGSAGLLPLLPAGSCLFPAPSSPSRWFYFLNLRTAGSLVLSSRSVYSAAGFRKSLLVPLQPTVFLPGVLGCSLASSKGTVPLSAPIGIQQ